MMRRNHAGKIEKHEGVTDMLAVHQIFSKFIKVCWQQKVDKNSTGSLMHDPAFSSLFHFCYWLPVIYQSSDFSICQYD
jgi:hypothetical protein